MKLKHFHKTKDRVTSLKCFYNTENYLRGSKRFRRLKVRSNCKFHLPANRVESQKALPPSWLLGTKSEQQSRRPGAPRRPGTKSGTQCGMAKISVWNPDLLMSSFALLTTSNLVMIRFIRRSRVRSQYLAPLGQLACSLACERNGPLRSLVGSKDTTTGSPASINVCVCFFYLRTFFLQSDTDNSGSISSSSVSYFKERHSVAGVFFEKNVFSVNSA